MRSIHHLFRAVAIVVIIFLIGYLLELLTASRSPMMGDYFIIATELLPLVLSFSIFIITWYSYNRNQDNHWLFLGAACLVIGFLDLFHLLSYPFMPDFISSNSLQKTTLFWSEARFVSAILFLSSVYVNKDTFPEGINKSVLLISSLISSGILFIVTIFFPYITPSMYKQNGIVSNAGIFLITVSILITIYAALIYRRKTKQTEHETIVYLIYGLFILIFSYPVYFLYEYSEHLLRAAGFYFLYIGIYKYSVDQPYENLAIADEKIRRQTEKKYHEIFDNAHDAIITCDLNENITSWNKSAEKMFGWMADEVVGKRLSQLIISPSVRFKMERIIEEVLSGKVVVGMESTNLRKDGSELFVSITITPLQGVDSKTNELSYIIQDLTERKKAEKALAWELEENAAISELSSTLLSQATIEDISVLILRHAKRLTGSKYGYAGYIDPNSGYLVCPTMSRYIIDNCKMKDSDNIIKEFKGLFGWVLANRKSILTNTPSNDPRSSGIPEGHIPVDRFLCAPALLKTNPGGQWSMANTVGNKIGTIRYYHPEKLVGQIALANSDSDYTNRDLAFIERLTDIYAIAINRHMAEEKIKHSLQEKEVLLREIHHRVKNNMQIISSLLSLQSNSMVDEKYKKLFKESQDRIVSMALIHEKLYQSEDIERIDLKDYINDLIRSLFQSYEVSNIELKIDVKNVFMGIDFAIPCGLIINELVTNSIKYAFSDGRRGAISILFNSLEKGFSQLDISDNGVGIPENIDINKTASLGLHLVTLLARDQLNGEINLDRNNGTKFIIKFKEVVK